MVGAEKLEIVAKSLGQNLSALQGTTQVVFDTVDGDTNGNYTFFEGANTRQLPDTNVKTNKPPYGQNLVVSVITLQLNPAETEGDLLSVGRDAYMRVTIGNQVVLKDIPLLTMVDLYAGTRIRRDDATFVFVPRTNLVIPSNVSFKVEVFNCDVALTSGSPGRCVIKGIGTIPNQKF